MGIKTQVLSVTDFVNKSTMLLENEDNLNTFYKGINYTMQHGFKIRQSLLENQNAVLNIISNTFTSQDNFYVKRH